MNGPSIAFRTDASLDIGTGHVMRCLTLADALRKRGADCRFICRAHAGNLINLISDRGHTVVALPADDSAHAAITAGAPAHARWLGTDWATDARQTADALGDTPVDWLIVDHYALDVRWERQLRAACRRLMVIDDLADRPHDCDLLLDQNLGRNASDYAPHVPRDCTLLIGPHYALLRPEFAALRAQSLARRERPELKRLLITMGGVDKDNATGQVLDALKSCALPPDCEITVVMGPHAPWLNEVRQLAKTMPWQAEVLVSVRDMAALMTASDLAIGAAGSTTWERCALGIPTLQLVLAENQEEAASALAAARAVILLSTIKHLAQELEEQMRRIGEDPGELHNLAHRAAEVCDGNGAHGVTRYLISPS